MDTPKIASFKQSDGIQDDDSPAGQYVGVGFYFSGTNATGQTGAFSNLGRVLTTRFDQQKDNISFADLAKILNVRGGVAMLDSTTGGAFEAYIFMLFTPETIASAINIADSDEFNYEWQPGDDGTVFSSLKLEIFGRTAQFPEQGKMNYNRKDETYNGQATADTIRLKHANIQDLFIEDVDDVITLVQVDNNNGQIQDAAPYGVLRGVTLAENNIESASFDFARLPFYTPGSVSYNAGTTVTVSVSGAGDVGLISANWEES